MILKALIIPNKVYLQSYSVSVAIFIFRGLQAVFQFNFIIPPHFILLAVLLRGFPVEEKVGPLVVEVRENLDVGKIK